MKALVSQTEATKGNDTAQPVNDDSFIVKTRTGFALDDGRGELSAIPTKRIVCPRCDGRGKHDHPAFSNGITASEWNSDDWDDDSRETYMRGGYDVACEECHGNNVVEAPDEERMSPEMLAKLHSYYRDEASYRAEVESERRMGA